MKTFGVIAAFFALNFGVSTAAQSAPNQVHAITITEARASLNGRWEGSLDYLDYSANEWFGIPVKTFIEDQGDKATSIRRSDFDDGPNIGNVRITSVELFDAVAETVTVGTFRKGRPAEINIHKIRMDGETKNAVHWIMVEEVLGKDDGRSALLRYTTTRDGDKIETIKQIDYQDDAKAEWITRNRTRLVRVTD